MTVACKKANGTACTAGAFDTQVESGGKVIVTVEGHYRWITPIAAFVPGLGSGTDLDEDRGDEGRMTTRRRDEQGAIAILTAVLAVVLLACAALAVDIASISSERQQLHDTVDTSALSGAMLLPDATAAQAQALAVAHNNDADSTPAVKFYCIVGSKNTPPVVDPMFIPAACNPGSAPYVARHRLPRA